MGGTRSRARASLMEALSEAELLCSSAALPRKVVHPCGGRFFQVLQHVVQRLDALYSRHRGTHEVALFALSRVGHVPNAHAFAMLASERKRAFASPWRIRACFRKSLLERAYSRSYAMARAPEIAHTFFGIGARNAQGFNSGQVP